MASVRWVLPFLVGALCCLSPDPVRAGDAPTCEQAAAQLGKLQNDKLAAALPMVAAERREGLRARFTSGEFQRGLEQTVLVACQQSPGVDIACLVTSATIAAARRCAGAEKVSTALLAAARAVLVEMVGQAVTEAYEAKARTSSAQLDLLTIRKEQLAYREKNGRFAPDLATLGWTKTVGDEPCRYRYTTDGAWAFAETDQPRNLCFDNFIKVNLESGQLSWER